MAGDFIDAIDVSAAFKSGAEKCIDHFNGLRNRGETRRNADDVGVVVLAGEAPGGDIVDGGRTGARDLVGRDRDADAAAADAHTQVGLAVGDGTAHGGTEIGVVDAVLTVGTEVPHVVAEVAEVSVQDGKPRVHRVVCAVDCGTVINPNTVAQQMESAVVFALTAALHSRIDIKDGAVQQSNFGDYPMVQLAQAPVVETWIVPSTRAPAGVGEPGVPPLAPAVANALFALTGKRQRALPFVA